MHILNSVQNQAYTYLEHLVSCMQSHPTLVFNRLAVDQYSYSPLHKPVGNMQVSSQCIYQKKKKNNKENWKT